MGLRPQASFSTGELDPVLQERTTLRKFDRGLNTARNVVITKTGSITSRAGRKFFVKTKTDNSRVVGYVPPNIDRIMEVGINYIRIYDFAGTLLSDVVGSGVVVDADLDDLHFETNGTLVYMTSSTFKVIDVAVSATVIFPFQIPKRPDIPTTALGFTINTNTGTGYRVEYVVSYIDKGEESHTSPIQPGGGIGASDVILLPVNPTEIFDVSVDLDDTADLIVADVLQARLYRRPRNGGAFGLVAISSEITSSAGKTIARFVDFGADADFTQLPISALNGISNLTGDVNSSGTPFLVVGDPQTTPPSIFTTHIVYQGRYIFAKDEVIETTRPGFTGNLTQDRALTSGSGLRIKVNSSGTAKILRMLDADGLIVFTKIGVFVNTGVLSPINLGFIKRGEWVINPKLPPLLVPSGIFFVDEINVIRQLIFSDITQSFQAIEQTIFSNQLFEDRTITSWGFQRGNFPLLWVVFDDGKAASFTYNSEQQMRAWTRHDSQQDIESVFATDRIDEIFFITKKGTERFLELTLPRKLPAADLVANPQANLGETIAYMDGIVTTISLQNTKLSGGDVFTITPVVAGVFDGLLTLTSGTSVVFTLTGVGAIGTIFRFFDKDGASVDLEVTARASDTSVTVQPNSLFPSTETSGFNLYETLAVITGLDHLDGESVSVIADGFIVASPFNDIENYPIVTVVAGSITLPDNLKGAIVHVGRPIIGDVETLEIDTVEQSPTLIESKNIDKMYVKVNKSRALYADNKFPKDDKVKGMESLDDIDVDPEVEIIGNKAEDPKTRRVEVTVNGDWEAEGKVAIRQVDPLHFEILSIIPDVEVLKRSDR